MSAFLFDVADDVIKNYYREISSIGFVFPNKRAAAFFRKYFGEILGKTTWSPNIFTIESLIKSFTGLKIPDKLSLLFDLYEITKEIFAETNLNGNQQNHFETTNYVLSFDHFYQIGEIILNDLSEIDSYLVDAKDIYRTIKDIDEIDSIYNYLTEEEKKIIKEFWINFSSEHESEEKKKFMHLWGKMPLIHQRLKEKLLNYKTGYDGLLYRYMADCIDSNQLKTDKYKFYIFIGFNALNKAEKKLFNYLNKKGLAKFYWDTDIYYQLDEKQEAGLFLRDNFKLLNQQVNLIPSNLKNLKKKIHLIGVPLEIGQAKSISTILNNYGISDNPEIIDKTAIILADENLLFPVLYSIPADISKINVTMGYPFKDTPLYSLLDSYMKMQNSAKSDSGSETIYFYKDVLSILQHPEIWEKNKEIASRLIDEIEKTNKIYVSSAFLINNTNYLFNLLFTPVNDKNNGIQLLTNILVILFGLFSSNKDENGIFINTIENEYIYRAYLNIKRLREIIQSKNQVIGISTITKIVKQLFMNLRIPFAGDLLNGLQIMGVMETRNLDFENIVILGLNEGIFPSTGKAPSFISENLRFAFGMPVVKHQDSIFAYLFYRILQRAENITLIYNNVTGYNSSGELSRFVQQLIYESQLEINHLHFKQDLIPAKEKPIQIEKNNQILSELSKYLKCNTSNLEADLRQNKQFSASALNSYLTCKLQFYFKYIVDIKEIPKVEEEINPAVFGNLIHKSIEYIYLDIKKSKQSKIVEETDIDNIINPLDFYIEKAFKEQYKIEDEKPVVYEGNQIIIKEVIKKHLLSILKTDKKATPFEITDLEGFAQAELDVEIDSKIEKVLLKGYIDRIDKKEGIYRIIDYKTGSVDKNFNGIDSLFNPFNNSRNKAAFQTFFYCLLYEKKMKLQNDKFYPAIYNLREINDDDFDAHLIDKEDRKKEIINESNLQRYLNEYKQNLSELITEIYNKEIPFSQTDNEYNCQYCNYKIICGKITD